MGQDGGTRARWERDGRSVDTGHESSMAPAATTVLVVTLCAIQFVDVLSTAIVILALPAIQADLGLSDGLREQVAAVYALLFGALLLLAGRLADAFGARRLFLLGLVAFGAGSLLGGLAQDGATLIVGRAIQGIGAALSVPAALALLTAQFPAGPGRDRVFGYWSATGAVGGGAGFLLGGLLTDGLGWRSTLLINVPVALAAIVAMALIPGRSVRRRGVEIPFGQSLLLTAGLLLLIFGLSSARSLGGAVPTAVVLLGAATALGLFARGERGPHPLVPRRVWGDSALIGGSLVGFTLTFTTTAAGVLLSLYLQDVQGLSVAQAGWLFATFNAGAAIGSWRAAPAVSASGPMRPMVAGLIGVAAGLALWCGALAFPPDVVTTIVIGVGMVIAGAGVGVASVGSTSYALAAAGDGEQGAASGVLNAGARVGAAIGIVAFGAIASLVAAAGPRSGEPAILLGYQAAFVAGIVLIVATLVVARRSGNTRGQRC